MDYKELLSSIACKCVVIFEDDFKQTEYNINRALYDITRMAIDDRNLYLHEIEKICSPLSKILLEYLSSFDKCFDKIGAWDENIPSGDISFAFRLIEKTDPSLKESIEKQYLLFSAFDSKELQKIYECGAKYGIGVDHPASFEDLYKNYVFRENRACPLRIYTDFSAETQRHFIDDIKSVSAEHSIVCIIDNYLEGTNRADEILEVITRQCESSRLNIVGSIFSSREMFEKINDKMYFEYVSKEHPENLKSCIAKSAYNYFISELKDETIAALNMAFSDALKNKSIAFFLAQKAQYEGTSEYEIINNWIKLLSIPSRKASETIKRMIRLSRVINSLEDTNELPDSSLQKINTLEAFDYTINDYFLPIAAGDIFTNRRDEQNARVK